MTLQRCRVLSGFLCIPLAILAALFVSCASLTPERVQVLAAIAGAAAQQGAQEWLKDHPTHRPAFDGIMTAIRELVRQGVTDQAKYVELLESLPTSSLASPDGELMWSGTPASGKGTPKLLVWDGVLTKPVPIEGEAVLPVMKQASAGLRRATVPMPPMPGMAKRAAVQTNVVSITNVVVQYVTMPQVGTTTEGGSPTDAQLDAEFQQYLAQKAKTNGMPKRIRVFRPGQTNGYEAVK